MPRQIFRSPFWELGVQLYERNFKEAMELVDDWWAFTDAAAYEGQQRSCKVFHWWHKRKDKPCIDRNKTALTEKKELRITEMLKKYGIEGCPLSSCDLYNVFDAPVLKLAFQGRVKLFFRSREPRRKFCKLFTARYCDKKSFGNPRRWDPERYAATRNNFV